MDSQQKMFLNPQNGNGRQSGHTPRSDEGWDIIYFKSPVSLNLRNMK